MDIQPVFNYYKVVAYMCVYLSKLGSECSVAMKQAIQHAFEKELDNYEVIKSVVNAYINKGSAVFRSVLPIITRAVVEKNISRGDVCQ